MAAMLSGEQLEVVADAVTSMQTLEYIVSTLGVEQEFALDEIASFGTWVAQSQGKGDLPMSGRDENQLPLFPSRDSHGAVGTSFQPMSLGGRDIRRAVNALATYRPGKDLIRQYQLKRAHSGASSLLTIETVGAVGFFARHGRISDLGGVNPKDPVFHQVLVQAYDLLEVGRQDALIGLVHGLGLGELPAGVTREMALSATQALFREEADLLVRAFSTGNGRLIASTQSKLVGRVTADPERFSISDICGLSEVQVLNLARGNGLAVEADQKAEAEARKLLEEVGVVGNAHNFLPDAIHAVHTDTVDEFRRDLQRELANL